MAKLTNVKTVDMVNGEITKVAYDGAEYAKVDDGQKGDIGLVVNDWGDQKVGEYYEIKLVSNDCYRIDGKQMIAACYKRRMQPFRKINVQTLPTLEARVTELETEVAALKGERVEVESPVAVKEGDEVTINFDKWRIHGMLVDLTEGKSYKVVKRGIDLNIVDDVGDARNLFIMHPEVVTVVKSQANETIEFKGAEYRKVDREAREGDGVIFKHGIHNVAWITKGKPYKAFKDAGEACVAGNDGDNICVYESDYRNRTRETVDVYEPIEQAKYVPQEGDIVVITANTSGHANNIGDIGKVGEEEPLSDGGVAVYVPGGPTRSIRTKPCDMSRATPAEVEKYEQAIHKASFAVGDYVKLIKSERGNVGAIAKIIKVGTFNTQHVDGSISVEPFKLEHLTGKIAGEITSGPAEWLVKATDAEIAKATAPKLKAGDFVKITLKRSWYTPEKVYEVIEHGGTLRVIDDVGDANGGALRMGEYEILSAEEAKWTKIGRKPNEFKKGDVVRVTTKKHEHKVGDIRIISPKISNHFDHALVGGGYIDTKNIELVSPVESVFK